MEGQCLSSPRWISLLVAEIFYPNALFPTTPRPLKLTSPIPHFDVPAPPVSNFQTYQQYLIRRAGSVQFPTTEPPTQNHDSESADYCDGYDEIGCLQIRLFYDWFLVPGACKCWKPSAQSVLLKK